MNTLISVAMSDLPELFRRQGGLTALRPAAVAALSGRPPTVDVEPGRPLLLQRCVRMYGDGCTHYCIRPSVNQK
jgi:hypothetical protein